MTDGLPPAVTRRQARHRLRALLVDFDNVLAREYEALRHRDAGSLETTVADKQRLVSEIDTLTHCAAPPASDTANDPDASEDWLQIRGLLARCALANRTNGAAIAASRCFVTSLLDVLCGRAATERTYNARGRLAGAHSYRGADRV